MTTRAGCIATSERNAVKAKLTVIASAFTHVAVPTFPTQRASKEVVTQNAHFALVNSHACNVESNCNSEPEGSPRVGLNGSGYVKRVDAIGGQPAAPGLNSGSKFSPHLGAKFVYILGKNISY